MRLCVDCPANGEDIAIRTRGDIPGDGTLLDIFGREAIAAPISIRGWTFVVIPIGHAGPLGFINELTAPIVVTWSRDALEAIPDFKHKAYSIARVAPYLIVTPGKAIWEISHEYERPARAVTPAQLPLFTLPQSRAGARAECAIYRGITYIDNRGAAILNDILPNATKTQRWLAGKAISWTNIVSEHIDNTKVKDAAASLSVVAAKLAHSGGGGKSISEREALLERRDTLLTALESYDKEINSIEVAPTRASSAELSIALGSAVVTKPQLPAPAPLTMDVAAARTRLGELAAILAKPVAVVPPIMPTPRLIDLAQFDPASHAAVVKYNEGIAAEIARGEARATDAKAARAENARRIMLEAEAAKLKSGLNNLELAAQWATYRAWKRTSGATAAEYEAAVAAETARARRAELISARVVYLNELLGVEREIGANKAALSSEEYRDLYSQYFVALEAHKDAAKEYKENPLFVSDGPPDDDRARKAIALAKITKVEYVVLKIAPSAATLRELAAAVPVVFIVNYIGADWFLPTRDSPAGVYLGRLVPLPAPIPTTCACGKTYKNQRKHMESAAHKKWALGAV